MDVQEWLAHHFEAELSSERVLNKAVAGRLQGGVEALKAVGLLTPQEARGHLHQLHQARERLARENRPDLPAPHPEEPQTTNPLRGVLLPLAPVVDIQGVTLVLLTVELWQRTVSLRGAGLESALTEARNAAHAEAFHEWAEQARQAKRANLPFLEMPSDEPGTGLGDVPFILSDDVGTTYTMCAGSAGRTGTEWRTECGFQPRVPDTARHLHIAVADHDGHEIAALSFDLKVDLYTPSTM